MEDSEVVFTPGLADVLQAGAPPSLEYWKSLPADHKGGWAIYVLTLEKADSKPRIYVGSGTHTRFGVAERWQHYDDKIHLPRYVRDSVDEGYSITHKGLLCTSPLPNHLNKLSVRDLFLVMECTISLAIAAMRPDFDDDGLPHLCMWPRELIEWEGLCSHLSMRESLIRSPRDYLSPDQLKA
ncbi:hypothetical protein VTI28DRAFT_7102 [Corynascus sepedonium]